MAFMHKEAMSSTIMDSTMINNTMRDGTVINNTMMSSIEDLRRAIQGETLVEGDAVDAAHFSDKRYASIPFANAHFHPIPKESAVKRAVFVDGGNLEILHAPNFSLQFIRIDATMYAQHRRQRASLYEYFVLLHAIPSAEGENIRYTARFFPQSRQRLPIEETDDAGRPMFLFDSMDTAFRFGHARADISSFGSVVRDLLEIIAAQEAANSGELSEGDCVIRDGTLEAMHSLQEHYLSSLFAAARKKGVVVASVAKTCDLLCASGRSLLGVLAQRAKQQHQQQHACWYYFPLVNIHKPSHPAIMTIARLHPRSAYLFRCEIHSAAQESQEHLQSVMSFLAGNSRDPLFLGYPYGLIEADRFARVSHKEADYLATRFMASCSKEWPDIIPFINARNAHQILDGR